MSRILPIDKFRNKWVSTERMLKNTIGEAYSRFIEELIKSSDRTIECSILNIYIKNQHKLLQWNCDGIVNTLGELRSLLQEIQID